VIDRGADVVAIQAYGRVLRIRLEQLGGRDCRITERRGPGNHAEVRIRDALQERGSERELVDRQLIEIRVGNADVRDLRARVGHFDRHIGRQFMLDRCVPLLDVARSQVAVDRKDALPEARAGREWNRFDTRAAGEHECWRHVVQRSL
jgi:hypothetical protein